MGFYIPAAYRERLLQYKYSSTDKSWVSKNVLGPYWSRLVLLFPETVAPNLITLMGLICVLINFATLLYYNPTLSCVGSDSDWDPVIPFMWDGRVQLSESIWSWAKRNDTMPPSCAPRWLFFTFAIGLFWYQSLDAIDGKQARRTGTSGPLGELFDHGCDALNVTLEVVLSASALNLGLSWWLVASLVGASANFYLTTWEEFHTGTLYLSAFSGPVEGILMIVGIYIITGFYGPQFWDTGVLTLLGIDGHPSLQSIQNIPLNELFVLFSAVGFVFNILAASRNVCKSLPAGKGLFSMIRPLLRLSPFVIHTSAAIGILVSPIGLKYIHGKPLLIPFMIFWGISFAHHVGLLILSHLASTGFPRVWKHPLLLVTLVAAIDSNASRWGYGFIGSFNEQQTQTFVYYALALSVIIHGHFIWEVIGDICEFYDINCLTIKKKTGSKQSPAEVAASNKKNK